MPPLGPPPGIAGLGQVALPVGAMPPAVPPPDDIGWHQELAPGAPVGPPPKPPAGLPPEIAARLGMELEQASGSAEPQKKRKRSEVEGLAKSRQILNGGSVTVYSGYSSTTTTPKQAGEKLSAGPSAPSP